MGTSDMGNTDATAPNFISVLSFQFHLIFHFNFKSVLFIFSFISIQFKFKNFLFNFQWTHWVWAVVFGVFLGSWPWRHIFKTWVIPNLCLACFVTGGFSNFICHFLLKQCEYSMHVFTLFVGKARQMNFFNELPSFSLSGAENLYQRKFEAWKLW